MTKLASIVLALIFLFPQVATEPQVTYASCTYAIVLWDNVPSFVDFETDGGLWLKPKTGLVEIVSVPLHHEFGSLGGEAYWSAVYTDQLDSRDWYVAQAYVYNIYGGIVWITNTPFDVRCSYTYIPLVLQ